MPTTFDTDMATAPDPPKLMLSKRLDAIGWGLLLILTGALWLVPDQPAIPGVWLLGTGVLLLVLNGVRYRMGISVSGLTTLLGTVALVAGLGEYFSVRLPLLAIFLIVVGGSIVLKPLVARKA
jgi:hypothetical protein